MSSAPTIYSWTVGPWRDRAITQSVSGVAGSRTAAYARVREALAGAPAGTSGEVARVNLSGYGGLEYAVVGGPYRATATRRGVVWDTP